MELQHKYSMLLINGFSALTLLAGYQASHPLRM